MLTDNIDILHAMKEALMKYETIDSDQVDDLMARITVRPPADWEDEKEADTVKSEAKEETTEATKDEAPEEVDSKDATEEKKDDVEEKTDSEK